MSVNPIVPGDVIAALEIHAAAAEKRAGRKLFERIDWPRAIEQNRESSIGDWVRLMHAVLRRKARCDAADDKPGLVMTEDVMAEVDRFKKRDRAPAVDERPLPVSASGSGRGPIRAPSAGLRRPVAWVRGRCRSTQPGNELTASAP